ncbi:hypothetical protein [Pseudooceanicola sediminis]|uniref:hypothetical protein n=1 Tax=Pseudooceanicola sediminis TaxID=2211117 RepID=UPI001314A1B1|nr:hypothetical protein [Pseudooceanicola sediminis]|tara:strand:- start:21739 stop:21894 length:156 start_codon:yes stop_codon:yes gene_type:complete
MIRSIVISALFLLPVAGHAQQTCAEKHQAQSCASGTQWNSQTSTCDVIVSS